MEVVYVKVLSPDGVLVMYRDVDSYTETCSFKHLLRSVLAMDTPLTGQELDDYISRHDITIQIYNSGEFRQCNGSWRPVSSLEKLV